MPKPVFTVVHHPTHLLLQSLIPTAYLSGSLALKIRGYDSAREVGDIDVYLMPSSEIQAAKVIKNSAAAIWDKLDKDVFVRMVELAKDEEYLDDEFVRLSFSFKYKVGELIKDLKVDFFCAAVTDDSVDYLSVNGSASSYKIEDGEKFNVPTLSAVDIIKFKVQHAMNGEGHWSERKQAADLVRFFAEFI